MKRLSGVFRGSDNSITLISGPFGNVEGTRVQGDAMRKYNQLDFAKLLGFDTVAVKLFEELDFQDQIIAARLGAKSVLSQVRNWRRRSTYNQLRLLSVPSLEITSDFQADVIEAKLGAKSDPKPGLLCRMLLLISSGEGNAQPRRGLERGLG